MLLSSSRRATAGEQIWSGCWQALTGTACHGRTRCASLPRAAKALVALSTPNIRSIDKHRSSCQPSVALQGAPRNTCTFICIA